MAQKTRIAIIRHGETEWNVALRLQGNSDSPLTQKGILQAERLAEKLKNEMFDSIISSDLKRARSTAEIVNKYHKLNILESVHLRERNFGMLEGSTREDIYNSYPNARKENIFRKEEMEIPEGETLREFYERVTSELRSIAKNNEGKRLLIVSHGGVLDCIIRMIFSYPLSAPRNFSINNTAVNRFICEVDKWIIEEWGNTSHLDGISLMDELKP